MRRCEFQIPLAPETELPDLGGLSVGAALLAPHRSYLGPLGGLLESGHIKALAHITGGGLVDNPTRMIPDGALLKLQLREGSWEVPPIFELLARGGRVAPEEMRRTFNMGIGMIVCVPADRAAEATTVLEREGEKVFAIGQVAAADAPDAPVEFLRA